MSPPAFVNQNAQAFTSQTAPSQPRIQGAKQFSKPLKI